MNEILERALDLNSCGYFHSPSALRAIFVSGSEKETCLWLPKATFGLLHVEIPRRHSGQEGPKVLPPLMGLLYYLSMNSALITAHLFLSLFPPWTNASGKGYSGMLTPLRRMTL